MTIANASDVLKGCGSDSRCFLFAHDIATISRVLSRVEFPVVCGIRVNSGILHAEGDGLVACVIPFDGVQAVSA